MRSPITPPDLYLDLIDAETVAYLEDLETRSEADHYMRPVVTTTWQHRDGLVTFR